MTELPTSELYEKYPNIDKVIGRGSDEPMTLKVILLATAELLQAPEVSQALRNSWAIMLKHLDPESFK